MRCPGCNRNWSDPAPENCPECGTALPVPEPEVEAETADKADATFSEKLVGQLRGNRNTRQRTRRTKK